MCQKCDWEDLVEQCDRLLADPDYEFASDTISGIREWVSDNEHATDSQKEAIENIENSKNR